MSGGRRELQILVAASTPTLRSASQSRSSSSILFRVHNHPADARQLLVEISSTFLRMFYTFIEY